MYFEKEEKEEDVSFQIHSSPRHQEYGGTSVDCLAVHRTRLTNQQAGCTQYDLALTLSISMSVL